MIPIWCPNSDTVKVKIIDADGEWYRHDASDSTDVKVN